MPARRTERPTPDLFIAGASKPGPAEGQEILPAAKVAPTNEPSLPRYVLPKDLAGALTRLEDGEIDALLAAVTSEAKRRGRSPAPTKTMSTGKSAEADRPAEKRANSPPRSKPAPASPVAAPIGDTAPSLPRGQANAVRAAFMAGVKPSSIARQFGISLAAVKQALATKNAGKEVVTRSPR